jgi:hypothetical protein
MVDELLESLTTRKTLERNQKDIKANFIKIYEVHGQLPLSYLTGLEKDENEFTQQMHVVSFVAKKGGKFDDFTLYKGKEEKNPYMITHLIKEDGRTMSIGAVENLFDSQWMVNHTTKQIKDQLDLASKLIFQTSDSKFVGQNALNAIESGDIMIHDLNQPLTQLQNNSHDITSLQNFGSEWKALGNEINGISEAMQGQNAPSGSAWRQTQALLQESHSLFELMTENKGLHIEDMFRTYVIPFIKKQMDTSDEITATLESYDLQKIDKQYVPYEATKRLAKQIINHIITTGTIPKVTDQMKTDAQSQVQGEVDSQGNQRYFVPSELDDMTWKELFKDLEWELEIDITGEQKDVQGALMTLGTALQTVVNPGYQNNPDAKLIINKILNLTGTVSPLELSQMNQPSQQAPANKVSESLSYKDAPPDVQRQIEAQAGLQPSQGNPVAPNGGMVGTGNNKVATQ